MRAVKLRPGVFPNAADAQHCVANGDMPGFNSPGPLGHRIKHEGPRAKYLLSAFTSRDVAPW